MEHVSRLLVEIGQAFGYSGLAILMFINTAIGAPPSELICITFGATVRQGEMNIIVVILVASTANLLGTAVLFALARDLGQSRVEAIIRRLHRSKWRYLASMAGWGVISIRKVNRLYDKHGYAIIFLGRLLPLVRSVVSIPAGLNRMSWIHFIALSAPGILIWVTIWTYVGYFAVSSPKVFMLTLLIAGVVIGLWIAYLSLRRSFGASTS